LLGFKPIDAISSEGRGAEEIADMGALDIRSKLNFIYHLWKNSNFLERLCGMVWE